MFVSFWYLVCHIQFHNYTLWNKAKRSKNPFFSPPFLFWCTLTGMPVKVTGGDCQEMLKLLPLGVNLADPGMFTGGVACVKRKYYSNKKNHSSSKGSFSPWNGKYVRDFPRHKKLHGDKHFTLVRGIIMDKLVRKGQSYIYIYHCSWTMFRERWLLSKESIENF